MKKYSVVVYISGKITDKMPYKQRLNILTAMKYNKALWEKGFSTICPHTNAPANADIKYRDYMDGDITLLKRCDCVLMIPNWIESNGAKEEMQIAYQMNLPVFYSIDELIYHYQTKQLGGG